MQAEAIQTIDELRARRGAILALAQQFRAGQVSVFGSILRGEMGAESDIDFLVDFQPDYELRDHIRLTRALRELLGRRVEVVDRRSLREELRAEILQSAKAL